MRKAYKGAAGLIVIIAFIAVAVTFSAPPTGMAGATEDKPVKIGIIAPLTGDAREWGSEVQRGAKIAFEELQDTRIARRSIEITYEDDKCDPKEGASALQKLIHVEGVKLTGGQVCSSVVLAQAPIVEQNSIVLLSAGASNPTITEAGEYIFRLWPSDAFVGKVLAKAARKSGAKSAGILYLNNDYGVGLKDAFSNTFAELGGEVRIAESFALNAKDFKTQLSKIKSKNPDALFFVSNPQEAPVILKQLRELGIEALVLTDGAVIEGTSTLEIATTEAEGVIYSIPTRETDPAFKQKYREKYGEDAGLLADIGYDTVQLLVAGAKHCGGDDPACVRDYLYGVKDYKGASADRITLDEKGDIVVDVSVKRVHDGAGVPLE